MTMLRTACTHFKCCQYSKSYGTDSLASTYLRHCSGRWYAGKNVFGGSTCLLVNMIRVCTSGMTCTNACCRTFTSISTQSSAWKQNTPSKDQITHHSVGANCIGTYTCPQLSLSHCICWWNGKFHTQTRKSIPLQIELRKHKHTHKQGSNHKAALLPGHITMPPKPMQAQRSYTVAILNDKSPCP